MFSIDITDEQRAHSEAARILKDAIEASDPFVVVSCASAERMIRTKFEGQAERFGDIIFGNVAGENGKYGAILLAGMVVQWLEQVTGLPRSLVLASIRGACKTLDKLKGGENVSGSEGEDAGQGLS
jgi:hypothetical protein